MLNGCLLTEHFSMYVVNEAEFPGKCKHKRCPADSFSLSMSFSEQRIRDLSWQETQQDREKVYRDTGLNLSSTVLFSVTHLM